MEILGALNETEDYLDYVIKNSESIYSPFCTSKRCTKETNGRPAPKKRVKMRDFCPDCNGLITFLKKQSHQVKLRKDNLR